MSRPVDGLPKAEQAVVGLRNTLALANGCAVFAQVLVDAGQWERAVEEEAAALAGRRAELDAFDPAVIASELQCATTLQTLQKYPDAVHTHGDGTNCSGETSTVQLRVSQKYGRFSLRFQKSADVSM
jgi:hypothetical protein